MARRRYGRRKGGFGGIKSIATKALLGIGIASVVGGGTMGGLAGYVLGGPISAVTGYMPGLLGGLMGKANGSSGEVLS